MLSMLTFLNFVRPWELITMDTLLLFASSLSFDSDPIKLYYTNYGGTMFGQHREAINEYLLLVLTNQNMSYRNVITWNAEPSIPQKDLMQGNELTKNKQNEKEKKMFVYRC